LRITTWNVNGLRASLAKGFIESVRAIDADVLCLQEIKSRPEQLPSAALAELQSLYPHQIWNPADRPGYSGTATLSRLQPDETGVGLGFAEYDVEGRVITHHFGPTILYNIYFPNGRNDLSRVPYKLDFYARLLEQCDNLQQSGKQVILCGDFNTCHKEIDLKNPKANAGSTGFLPHERAWIDTYLEHGFVDAFRRLYPDKVEYTWWTFISRARERNVGWRLDYFLISEALYPSVNDVTNHTETLGSDHCPVSLHIA
jgi:exodeoxyribonuclease III